MGRYVIPKNNEPEALDIYHCVLDDVRTSLKARELARRGVAADSGTTRWMLEEGKPLWDPYRLADALIESIEIIDRLVELWRRFDAGVVPSDQFDSDLEFLVVELETWLAQVREVSPGHAQ